MDACLGWDSSAVSVASLSFELPSSSARSPDFPIPKEVWWPGCSAQEEVIQTQKQYEGGDETRKINILIPLYRVVGIAGFPMTISIEEAQLINDKEDK